MEEEKKRLSETETKTSIGYEIMSSIYDGEAAPRKSQQYLILNKTMPTPITMPIPGSRAQVVNDY